MGRRDTKMLCCGVTFPVHRFPNMKEVIKVTKRLEKEHRKEVDEANITLHVN